MTTASGETFDLWKTGWSTFVWIPKDLRHSSVRKLVVMANVNPNDSEKCAPAFLQDVKATSSITDGHEIFVRAGLLDGATPFVVSFDSSGVNPSDTSRSSDILAASSYLLSGKSSETSQAS